MQEQWDTPLVESYNQQHVFIWVRNNLNLPSVQGHRYTEWELCEAWEIRTLIKSSYYDILDFFGVPKSTLTRSLNINFPSLKCSSLKHLWDIILVGKIKKRIVREVTAKIVVKNKSGKKTYLLKDNNHTMWKHQKYMVHMESREI